jgi:pimeloyl-ACP methyl ester carboxylesterase
LYPVFGLLLLAAVGGIYETISEQADPLTHAAVGQMVDVGGHKLYLSCAGSGDPTVVFEPGLGAISSAFGLITPAVEKDTKVCVYDRAGRGLSESASGRPDGMQVAADLHTLLQEAHIPGPYVLVGHSFGGLYSLIFAAEYPDDVAGLVLLDSTSPEQVERKLSGWPGFYEFYRRATALMPSLARLGVTRLIASSSYGDWPADARDEQRANSSPRWARSQRDEFAQSRTSMQQAQSLQDFGDKPLMVLAAGKGHEAAWFAAQEDLAKLSTGARYRVVPGATHQSLLDDKDDAAVSSQAILEVVHALRAGTPLAASH